MSNSQLYLAMAMPTFAVLVGIVINLVQIGGLRGDIASLRAGQDMLTGKIFELVDRVSRLEIKRFPESKG